MDLAQITLNPGFIVLSALVSFIGILFALELLQRRTSIHGSTNWYLLVGAATSLGAVGMWSQHFLSNRAVVNLNGPQVLYSPLGTVASFFTPIICMGLSLYPMSHSELWSIVEISITGLMAGAGALAMYFISDATMLNYSRVSISAGNFTAAVIAVLIGNCMGFGLFFGFKVKWTSNFPNRSACALLLAGTVSAMQWALKLGTKYKYTGNTDSSPSSLSRNAEIVAPLLLGITCLVSLCVLARMRWVLNQQASERIPQMLLGCAFFDSNRNLMVSPEGWVPCKKITNARMEKGFENLFDINHPLFCWLYRASFCWRAIKDAFPRMPTEIEALKSYLPNNIGRHAPNMYPTTSFEEGVNNPPDRTLLFRLLFLITAKQLADMLEQPVEKIGNLFGGVLDTGTARRPGRFEFGWRKPASLSWLFKLLNRTSVRDHSNPNHSNPNHSNPNHSNPNHRDQETAGEERRIFGRGQAMFLIRTVSAEESRELEAVGYRFAPPGRVIRAFAREMEITKEEARIFLRKMQVEAAGQRVYAPGVHVAAFIVRPHFGRGLGVLVRKDARHVLPAAQLPISSLEDWQKDFLFRMHNFTLNECCLQLEFDRRNCEFERERDFAVQLLKAIADLRVALPHPSLGQTTLHAYPLEAPSGMPGESSPLNPAFIIAFRIMMDIYPNLFINPEFTNFSWRFFATLQRVFIGYPHHGAFVHHMRRQLVSLHRDDVPEARESRLQRARRSINRLSRNAFDRVRFDAPWGGSNRINMPAENTFELATLRGGVAQGKRAVNRNIYAPSAMTEETAGPSMGLSMGQSSVDMLDMLGSRPDVEIPNDNDTAPLDKKTYADILLRVIANDRRYGIHRPMDYMDPSF